MDDLCCDDSHYQGNAFTFTSSSDKGFTHPIRCAIYPHRLVVGTTFRIKGKTTEYFESFSVNLTLSNTEHLDNCEVHYNPRLRPWWYWYRRVVVLNHRVNKQWGPGERQDSVFTKNFHFELVMEVMPGAYSFKVNGGSPMFYKRTREESDINLDRFLLIKGDCYIDSIQIEKLQTVYSPSPISAVDSLQSISRAANKTAEVSKIKGNGLEKWKKEEVIGLTHLILNVFYAILEFFNKKHRN